MGILLILTFCFNFLLDFVNNNLLVLFVLLFDFLLLVLPCDFALTLFTDDDVLFSLFLLSLLLLRPRFLVLLLSLFHSSLT